jgi:hypothetical protein
MTDVPETTTTRLETSLSDRIAAARAQLAAEREGQKDVVDPRKMEKFESLFEKLFGEEAAITLGATFHWREQPVAVFTHEGTEHVIAAVPEWTGHVSWQLDGVELFKQKYAPEPGQALEYIVIGLAGAVE